MKQERKTTYNTFAVLFYINRQKVKKNGLCPLMGRISINTEVAQFSTKMEVQPDLWDVPLFVLHPWHVVHRYGVSQEVRPEKRNIELPQA